MRPAAKAARPIRIEASTDEVMLKRLSNMVRKSRSGDAGDCHSARWDRIGSPSYRRAIRELYARYGASAIRRTAWGEAFRLCLHDYRRCHDSNIKDRLPKDLACHPPGYLLVQITTRDSLGHTVWETRWWPTPAEDINAHDWEYYVYGQWRAAIESPEMSQS